MKKKVEIKKVLSLLTLLLFITSWSIGLTYAYDPWGYEWRESDIEPLYYKDYSGYDELTFAVNSWNNKNCTLDLSSGTGLQALLWIYKVDLSGVAWDGQCEATDTTGSYFDLVDIKINDYYVAWYDTNGVRSVIGHELGHAHGLAHDDNEECIMISSTWARYTVLDIYMPTSDDEDGIQSIYGTE